MSEREKIFSRIRGALKRRAALPGTHDRDHPVRGNDHAPRSAAAEARNWLPPSGDTFDQWVELFRTNAAELKSEFILVENVAAIASVLQKLRATEGWKRVGSHSGPLVSTACSALGVPILSTDHPYDVHELEGCDAGITECDALIAQTGSVLVTSRSSGGRALSVLPPHHVVLARREQLLPDLPAAFEMLQRQYAGDYPSFISLITGPSRTGDIERILVLGAHGPKRLTILCG